MAWVRLLGPGADAGGRDLDTDILHGRGLRGAVGSIPYEGTILRAVDQLRLGGCDLRRLRPVYRHGTDQCRGDPIAPAYYVMVGGLLTLIALFFVREGAGKPLLD
jgi:hypothetical protein